MDAKHLGHKIQELLKEKGMTQGDLAEKTGLSVRTIQIIESGEVDPRTYTLHQIADALGINITELTNDTGEEENQTGKTDKRKRLTLLHLSGFLALLFPPLIIWISKRGTYPAMDHHGKAVMNFQISM